MTYKIWNCPSFSAVLGTFWKLAWTLCCYPCALAQKLSNLLVHVTEKVHIGCSPAQALVFHQEVFEQHLQLVLLFHHNELHVPRSLCPQIINEASHLLRQQIIQNWQNTQATGDLTEGRDAEEALDNALLDTCSHPEEEVEPVLQQIYIPIA